MADVPAAVPLPHGGKLPGRQVQAAPSGAYTGYVVAMFGLVSMLCIADRYILSIILEPIRTEFGVSDTTMGMLAGTAYAVERSLDMLTWTNAPSGTNAGEQSARTATAQTWLTYKDTNAISSNRFYRVGVDY